MTEKIGQMSTVLEDGEAVRRCTVFCLVEELLYCMSKKS